MNRPERGVRRGIPPLIAVPAAIGVAFLFLPLVALLIRAPWSNLLHLLSSNTATTALRLSLECATAATAVSFVLGVPLAWVLARVQFPGRGIVRVRLSAKTDFIDDPVALERDLPGTRVKSVARYGKFLVLDLERGVRGFAVLGAGISALPDRLAGRGGGGFGFCVHLFDHSHRPPARVEQPLGPSQEQD